MMAYYLVTAVPKADRLRDLEEKLLNDAFARLQPFGKALTYGLRHARRKEDGRAVWEEEDYCTPPLAEERAAVLDHYFDDLQVERVKEGEGWKRIKDLPPLFPVLDMTD